MSRPLKKSIKNNGMMKVNKKVINFKNKSGGVLLRVFCVNVSVFLCYCFLFFCITGIAENSTIMPEYPSLAQT